jgi:hypothetical protein
MRYSRYELLHYAGVLQRLSLPSRNHRARGVASPSGYLSLQPQLPRHRRVARRTWRADVHRVRRCGSPAVVAPGGRPRVCPERGTTCRTRGSDSDRGAGATLHQHDHGGALGGALTAAQVDAVVVRSHGARTGGCCGCWPQEKATRKSPRFSRSVRAPCASTWTISAPNWEQPAIVRRSCGRCATGGMGEQMAGGRVADAPRRRRPRYRQRATCKYVRFLPAKISGQNLSLYAVTNRVMAF